MNEEYVQSLKAVIVEQARICLHLNLVNEELSQRVASMTKEIEYARKLLSQKEQVIESLRT